MENNEKQNDSKSPNDNFLKLFFSKRFLSIRILVLTSVLSSILLLTPISVFFSCQLSVFQNVVIPFMGTLMYLVKARFGTYSQRLKESGLVGGMIGLTSAGSYVLISIIHYYFIGGRHYVYSAFGYKAPTLSISLFLVETQIWIIPVVFLAIVSTIFGLFAAVLPIRKWLEVNADELDVTAVHNTHEEL